MKMHALKIGLALALTAALLYFFGRSVDWKSVPAQITDVNVPLFLLATVLSALHFVTRSARWHILVARQKIDVRFRNLVSANVVGFTVSFVFPGRLGELVRPLYLARKEGLKPGFTIGTVVVERLFDITTMCGLLGVFLVARPLFEASWPIGVEAGRRLTFLGTLGIAIAAVLLVIILILYFFKEWALRTAGFLVRQAWRVREKVMWLAEKITGNRKTFKPLPAKAGQSVLKVLAEFIDGLRFFRTRSQLALYALLSLVVWLGVVFFYWVFFAAYHVHVPYFLVIPYVFMTGVGASIPTPGMVGGFHYFSKLGMVLVLGLEAGRAAGLTLVFHAVQIAVTCLLGYAILAHEGLTLLQLRRMGESETT